MAQPALPTDTWPRPREGVFVYFEWFETVVVRQPHWNSFLRISYDRPDAPALLAIEALVEAEKQRLEREGPPPDCDDYCGHELAIKDVADALRQPGDLYNATLGGNRNLTAAFYRLAQIALGNRRAKKCTASMAYVSSPGFKEFLGGCACRLFDPPVTADTVFLWHLASPWQIAPAQYALVTSGQCQSMCANFTKGDMHRTLTELRGTPRDRLPGAWKGGTLDTCDVDHVEFNATRTLLTLRPNQEYLFSRVKAVLLPRAMFSHLDLPLQQVISAYSSNAATLRMDVASDPSLQHISLDQPASVQLVLCNGSPVIELCLNSSTDRQTPPAVPECTVALVECLSLDGLANALALSSWGSKGQRIGCRALVNLALVLSDLPTTAWKRVAAWALKIDLAAGVDA